LDESPHQQGESTAIAPGSVEYPLLIVFQLREQRKPSSRNAELATHDSFEQEWIIWTSTGFSESAGRALISFLIGSGFVAACF
jgi:hypothetical protein